MPKQKKKNKLLTGNHDKEWYIKYSTFSGLIIVGFFIIFAYYAMIPQNIITSFQTATVETMTMDQALYRDYPLEMNPTTNLPGYFYLAIGMVVAGVLGFLSTKIKYEKKHGKIKKGEFKWLK